MPIKLEINPNSLPAGFGGSSTDGVTNSYISKVSAGDRTYTQIPTYVVPVRGRTVVDIRGMEDIGQAEQGRGEDGGGL